MRNRITSRSSFLILSGDGKGGKNQHLIFQKEEFRLLASVLCAKSGCFISKPHPAEEASGRRCKRQRCDDVLQGGRAGGGGLRCQLLGKKAINGTKNLEEVLAFGPADTDSVDTARGSGLRATRGRRCSALQPQVAVAGGSAAPVWEGTRTRSAGVCGGGGGSQQSMGPVVDRL